MAEHYPRKTVWISAHCVKCGHTTPHRVDDRRKGPCLICIAKLNAAHEAAAEKAAKKPVQGWIDWLPPAA